MDLSCPRHSGIQAIGDLGWGAHFCYWYQGTRDLLDVLIPYYAAGLSSNEQCLWVTSAPLTPELAGHELVTRAPALRPSIECGQISIIDHNAWYALVDGFDPEVMYASVIDAADTAVARGYAGLRAGANIGFLHTAEDWTRFARFESNLTQTMSGRRVLAICAYDMAQATGSNCTDVLHSHQFCLPTMLRNDGKTGGRHLRGKTKHR
jgi:MEDS: MEthanogen/methylotroph, DcmR Sensory domain